MCLRKEDTKTNLLLISFVIFLLLLTSKAMAFGPNVVDVTTRSISLIWTSSTVGTPGIKLYKSASSSSIYTTTELNNENINIYESSDADARANGIMKVTIEGLSLNTDYKFYATVGGIKVGNTKFATTADLHGLSGNIEDVGLDFPGNHILHKSVYKIDGKSPAKGVYVLAEIVNNYDVPISTYPISSEVGVGMPSEYGQYASINMNNFYAKSDNRPLRLEPNDRIKLTILRGTLDVFGQKPSTDNFVEYGKVGAVTKDAGENYITMAKVIKSFHFKSGYNMFSLPCDLKDENGNPIAYTSKDLIMAIEAEGGNPEAVYGYKEEWGGWRVDQRIIGTIFSDTFTIEQGSGCIIQMAQDMPQDKYVVFYGDPDSAKITLGPGYNFISLPQVSINYTSKQIIENLESIGAKKVSVYGYKEEWGGWRVDQRIISSIFSDTFDIVPGGGYIVYISEINNGTNEIKDWDPFED